MSQQFGGLGILGGVWHLGSASSSGRENIDSAAGDGRHRDDRDGRLQQHQHFRTPRQRQRIGRAERKARGES